MDITAVNFWSSVIYPDRIDLLLVSTILMTDALKSHGIERQTLNYVRTLFCGNTGNWLEET